MKTLYLTAALLMAATSAHAGSGISFVVDGQQIHIDAPKNCSSLDCIKITGAKGANFNLKGFGSKKNDDDVAAATPAAAPSPFARCCCTGAPCSASETAGRTAACCAMPVCPPSC